MNEKTKKKQEKNETIDCITIHICVKAYDRCRVGWSCHH